MTDKKNINAAYRLLTIVKAAVAMEPKTQQGHVWSVVFGLQSLNGRRQKEAIGKGILLIYGQLDQAVQQLKGLNHPEDSYSELVAKIEQNISFEYLAHPWQDFRGRLETTIYPLTIIGNTLPNEECLIDPAELKAISDELDNLENALAERELSPELRGYLERQIAVIRKALWEYQFRGVQAFGDAVFSSARETWSNKETVDRHKDDPSVKQLTSVQSKVWQVIDKAGKVGALLSAGEHLRNYIDVGIKLLHHH